MWDVLLRLDRCSIDTIQSVVGVVCSEGLLSTSYCSKAVYMVYLLFLQVHAVIVDWKAASRDLEGQRCTCCKEKLSENWGVLVCVGFWLTGQSKDKRDNYHSEGHHCVASR